MERIPSLAGQFASQHAAVIAAVAQQLVANQSSFDCNIYPYFALADVQNLQFALGNVSNTVDGVVYSCLLDQQVLPPPPF